MTFIVKQSEIDEHARAASPWLRDLLNNFSLSVQQHALDLATHYTHMEEVVKQAVLPDGYEGKTHQAYPTPHTSPLIDQAVRRDTNGKFIPDFQIINDRASTEQLAVRRLRKKKDALTTLVTEEETRCLETIIPARKRRFLQIQYADVMVKRTFGDGGILQDYRSSEELAFCKDYENRASQFQVVIRHAAQLHSDIEDLTLQNVDSWTMTPFPNV
jgi:hypothetical protein